MFGVGDGDVREELEVKLWRCRSARESRLRCLVLESGR